MGGPLDDADIILVDARGHRCPVPALRLRRAIEAANIGARLRLLADDPLALIDVPFLVKQLGYQIEFQTKTDPVITFVILKESAE